MKRTFFQNARLLDPASNLDVVGGLLVEGSVIADFGPHLDKAPADAEVIDCQGLCLSPGLIDIRVHLCEPVKNTKKP
mgnify:FL=1